MKTNNRIILICVKCYVWSAAAILTVTGAAKVWAALNPTKILAAPDPITGVSFGRLMLAIGVLELLIAVNCLFSRSQKLSLALIAWLSTSFWVYRIGFWWVGWHKPCECMGNLTDALHMPPQTADTAIKIILAYLLIGSYATLFWLWRQKRKSPP